HSVAAYSHDRIETGKRGPGHVKKPVGSECQVKCGHARLDRRKGGRFAYLIDRVDRSASIADEEATFRVKRDSSGDSKVARVNLGILEGRHPINRSIIA